MSRKIKILSISMLTLLILSAYSAVGHVEITFDFKFGSFGATDGLFDTPVDVEVYGNEVFVTDTGNNRIQKFDLNGNFLTSFGSLGSGPDQLDNPAQIAVNSTTVMVTDYNNARIQLYDHDGNYLGSLGQDSLLAPVGITTDGKHIYVSDQFTHQIKMFDMNGLFVKNITIVMSGYPYFLDMTEDYVYLVCAEYSSGVDYYDLTGNWIGNMIFRQDGDPYGLGNTYLAYGIHITDDRIYVSDYSKSKIVVSDHQHNFDYEVGIDGNLDGQFKQPAGMGSSDTQLYVADSANNRIDVFTIQPSMTTTTETITKTFNFTETKDGGSGGSFLSNLPFNTSYFFLALLMLLPIVRYRRSKR